MLGVPIVRNVTQKSGIRCSGGIKNPGDGLGWIHMYGVSSKFHIRVSLGGVSPKRTYL